MKHIGIVASRVMPRALALKAALLAADKSVAVSVDEATARLEAPEERTALADFKIETYLSVQRLVRAGAEVIAFADPKVAEFMTEVKTEIAVRMVAPTFATEAEYAAALLASETSTPKRPFKVGMIGGLGPAATVDLYDKIVRASPAKKDQEHIKLVVEQNPQIPDRTAALLEGGADPTLALYDCAHRLQEDGCDALIIPCNTAHAFAPFMARHLTVPFINMQQATVDEIVEKLGDKARVGLMATTGTVRTRIYAQKFEAAGVPMFVPDDEHQKRVMAAIYGPKGAKAGFTDGECHDDLVSAAEYLVKTYDCNVLILGCTELPLILDEGDFDCAGKTVFIIDPTSALARKVVKLAYAENAKRAA